MHAEPIEKRLASFRRRYWRMYQLGMMCETTRRRLVSYIRAWCAAFSAWNAIGDFAKAMLGGVDEARRRGEVLLAACRS